MTSFVCTDDQGQLIVSVDGGDPQPVQNIEEACSIMENAFGQPDGDDKDMPAEEMTTNGMEQMPEEGFAKGFENVRGGGLNR